MTLKQTLLNVLVLFIFSISLVLLYRELKNVGWGDIIRSLGHFSTGRLLLAGCATALNYLVVCCYDLLACRYFRISLPAARVLFAAFVGDAVSNVAGYGMFSGGAVRYRLYSSWGIPFHILAEMMVFISLMLWLGLISVSGMMFIVKPSVAALALHCPLFAVQGTGALFIAVTMGYVMFSGRPGNLFTVGTLRIRLPTRPIAAGQVAISSADWLLAALVLYSLLPQPSVPFFVFLAVYLPAQLLAIVSQVPAGLGVFETVVLLLFPKTLPTMNVFASLVAFRIVYYVIPFVFAGTLMTLRGLGVFRRQEKSR